MKEKYLINARIIDPKNNIDEIGGLIIDSNGIIKASGKNVSNGNLPSSAEKIDALWTIKSTRSEQELNKTKQRMKTFLPIKK